MLRNAKSQMNLYSFHSRNAISIMGLLPKLKFECDANRIQEGMALSDLPSTVEIALTATQNSLMSEAKDFERVVLSL